MSDEAPQSPGPLPTVETFPAELIRQWVETPPEHVIQVPVSRADVDNLFFSITEMAAAISAMDGALVAYTNGRLEDANLSMHGSRVHLIQSQNHIRRFMMALMAGAQPQNG